MKGRGFALPSWLRLRVVGAVVLVIGCAFAGATLLGRSAPSQRYWAVTRDLAAGTVLTGSDLSLVSEDLAQSGPQYLGGAESPAGLSLTQPMTDGQLVPRAAVGPVPAGASVVIALTPGASPAIQRGDRVRVWASTTLCPLAVVLPDVTVQDITVVSASGFGSAGTQRIVVLVPATLAARAITARSLTGAILRAAVLDGPADGATASLPDLTTCQSG